MKKRDIISYAVLLLVLFSFMTIPCLAESEPEQIKPEAEYTYPIPQNRNRRVRPLSGGISISNSLSPLESGTLGIVTRNPYILSCAHILAMDANGIWVAKGTPILQPGISNGGSNPADRVGTLYDYIQIYWGQNNRNYADAALATVEVNYWAMRVLARDNQHTMPVAGWATVSQYQTVYKSGKETGVTSSTVEDAGSMDKYFDLGYPNGQTARFYDVIVVNNPNDSFAKLGDSGSIVWDSGGHFVGLIFYYRGSTVLVCKAAYIVAKWPGLLLTASSQEVPP